MWSSFAGLVAKVSNGDDELRSDDVAITISSAQASGNGDMPWKILNNANCVGGFLV